MGLFAKDSAARVGRMPSRRALRRLEWVAIAAPFVLLTVYHALLWGPLHDMVHTLPGTIAAVVAGALAAVAFARVMFYAILRLHRNVEILSEVADRRSAQLRALNEANLALSQERLVSDVLQQVVELSRELVHAQYAALSVLDENGRIKAFHTAGMDVEARRAIGQFPSGKGLLGHMLHRTDPLRLTRIQDDPESAGFPSNHPPMTTFLGVPIRSRTRVLGSLYLTEKAGGQPFTEEDEEVVRLFANQAAVAIESAQLNDKLQAMATETERTRISREMHDGLAQVLSFVSIKAQAVEAFMANGQTETAMEQVRELSQAARAVYQDVREGILALRSQTAPGRPLSDVVREYVDEFRHQVKREVQVEWNVAPGALDLTPLQEVQLLRIVQEAMTNARKHADARRITLAFTDRDGTLEVEVRDNGRGFNPLAIERGEWPHLGLQTMQERAEAIGGRFDVDSAPGKGTTVRVLLPRAVHATSNGGTP